MQFIIFSLILWNDWGPWDGSLLCSISLTDVWMDNCKICSMVKRERVRFALFTFCISIWQWDGPKSESSYLMIKKKNWDVKLFVLYVLGNSAQVLDYSEREQEGKREVPVSHCWSLEGLALMLAGPGNGQSRQVPSHPLIPWLYSLPWG